MIKHNFEILYYHLKKDKYLFLAILVIIYILCLPICLNQLNQKGILINNSVISCFNEMQKSILVMAVLIQSVLFKAFVDTEYKDVIYSLDLKKKYGYIYLYTFCIIVILIPFFSILYLTNSALLPYILIISLQILVLSSGYYCLSMILESTLTSISILIVYLLFFTFLYQERCMGNIILFNVDCLKLSNSYYVYCLLFLLVSMLIGNYFEKQFVHK